MSRSSKAGMLLLACVVVAIVLFVRHEVNHPTMYEIRYGPNLESRIVTKLSDFRSVRNGIEIDAPDGTMTVPPPYQVKRLGRRQ